MSRAGDDAGRGRGGKPSAKELTAKQQRLLYCTLQRPPCAPPLSALEIEADLALINNRKRRRGNTRNGANASAYDSLPECTRVCSALLLELRHGEGAALVNGPASEAGWPEDALKEYYEGECKVNDALDLSVVQQRLSQGEYKSAAPFVADVRAVLRDAAYCAAEGSELRRVTLALWGGFEKHVRKIELAEEVEIKPILVVRSVAEAAAAEEAAKAAAAAAEERKRDTGAPQAGAKANGSAGADADAGDALAPKGDAAASAANGEGDTAAAVGETAADTAVKPSANGAGSAGTNGGVYGAGKGAQPAGGAGNYRASGTEGASGGGGSGNTVSATCCTQCGRDFKSPQALAGHRRHCMR